MNENSEDKQEVKEVMSIESRHEEEDGNETGAFKTLFVAVIMCILVAGAIWNSRELWKGLIRREAPVPVPYMINSSEYKGTSLSKDGASFTATYKIDVFEKEGWKKIELLPAQVAIISSRLPEDSYLHLADGKYSMLTKKSGKIEAEISFSVAPKETDGIFTVNFSRVPSVTCTLDASFPGEEVEVEVTGAQSTESDFTNELTVVKAALPDDTPIALKWEPALPEIEEGPPKYYSETRTLISIADGLIIGQTKVDFSVLHTPTREFELKIPEGVSVLEITGSQLRDWREKDGKLSVQLEKEVIGPYTMNVKYESSPDMSSGKIKLPVITGSKVEREKGDIGIVSLANLELENSNSKDAHLVDVRELPPEIVGLTTQPILLAYKYVDPEFDVELAISKHSDVNVLLTIIDRVNFTIVQAFDGKRITRAVYNVRNNRNQFLRLEMPEGSELWSASVAGRSTQPTKDDEGRILIPLVRSESRGRLSSFPVEIVYAEEGTRPDEKGAGIAKVNLPVSVQPIMHMMVSLYVPEEGRYDDFEGTLREVEHFTALKGTPDHIHSHVANAPAIRMNANAPNRNAQAMQQLIQVKQPSAPGSIEVQFPTSGEIYLLEKILVVKDEQWFSYEFSRLRK